MKIIILTIIFSGLFVGCSSNNDFKKNAMESAPINADEQVSDAVAEIRVPAEWELHAATWIQWA